MIVTRGFETKLVDVDKIVGSLSEHADLNPDFTFSSNLPVGKATWHARKIESIRKEIESGIDRITMPCEKPIKLVERGGLFYVEGDGNHRVYFAKHVLKIQKVYAVVFDYETYDRKSMFQKLGGVV